IPAQQAKPLPHVLAETPANECRATPPRDELAAANHRQRDLGDGIGIENHQRGVFHGQQLALQREAAAAEIERDLRTAGLPRRLELLGAGTHGARGERGERGDEYHTAGLWHGHLTGTRVAANATSRESFTAR